MASETMRHVLHEIEDERDRQDRLWVSGKIPFSCRIATISDADKLVVLVDEVGEVARALQCENGNLREELIRVAAVAAAWAESLPK